MSTFVFDCPSCMAKYSTFEVNGYTPRASRTNFFAWSLFSTCRVCNESCCITANINKNDFEYLNKRYSDDGAKKNQITEYLRSHHDLSHYLENFNYSPILPNSKQPPEYLPIEVEEKFKEAAKCLAIDCYNAAGAMFRLCLDITTKQILLNNTHLNPSKKDENSIHSRLIWIFDNNILPADLEDLSRSIKDDGNDAAHDGSLSKGDAEDLLDFTYILLERVYTEPERVKIATQRRIARSQAQS